MMRGVNAIEKKIKNHHHLAEKKEMKWLWWYLIGNSINSRICNN